jgi:hypothetical protein
MKVGISSDRWVFWKCSYSRRAWSRCRWFRISVRSRSSRRQLRIHWPALEAELDVGVDAGGVAARRRGSCGRCRMSGTGSQERGHRVAVSDVSTTVSAMIEELLQDRLSPFRDEALSGGIPAGDVERWSTLARPCATLTRSGDGPVVGRFGGPLLLPADAPDPAHPFVASIDLATSTAGLRPADVGGPAATCTGPVQGKRSPVAARQDQTRTPRPLRSSPSNAGRHRIGPRSTT